MNGGAETIKENTIFTDLAMEWWDESGAFKALHAINPVRLNYILCQLRSNYSDLRGLKVLDIGCGGGLLCEPLSRLGLIVTGVDESEKAIEVAKHHSLEQGLSIKYLNTSAESLTETFDVILLLEVLEHVNDYDQLLKTAVGLLKPGGVLFFSTLNRSPKAYFGGIFLAENILKWAPKGTHQWLKFIRPSEIIHSLENLEVRVQNISGLTYSILKRKWEISSNLDINYIGYGYNNKNI